MTNPLSRLVVPWYPAAALGLEHGTATIVQLERGRDDIARIRRAATLTLSESLVRPSFNEPNISDLSELATALRELAASAGLLKQRRWSVSLPEAAVRTLIVTLETSPSTKAELEEILSWKIERGFGVGLDEITTSRWRLSADAQGKARYLIVAVHRSVLAEYESVFAALGWRVGLLLPRHMGESQWLTKNGFQGDALLLSASTDGFTAVVYRDKQPLVFRAVSCEPEECEDELYRLLMFYRDRRGGDNNATLSRLLVLGSAFPKARAVDIANETLGTSLRALAATDVGLELPGSELPFDTVAAPAGLATLSWQ
ncbi:MAG TPA: hypothetical protein VJ023_17730 [Pyrinomonadaceae bacterium]|nr:hypothetical protein [Pyrinomonadaceae bacterium]